MIALHLIALEAAHALEFRFRHEASPAALHGLQLVSGDAAMRR
jgi:hypothetical protein